MTTSKVRRGFPAKALPSLWCDAPYWCSKPNSSRIYWCGNNRHKFVQLKTAWNTEVKIGVRLMQVVPGNDMRINEGNTEIFKSTSSRSAALSSKYSVREAELPYEWRAIARRMRNRRRNFGLLFFLAFPLNFSMMSDSVKNLLCSLFLPPWLAMLLEPPPPLCERLPSTVVMSAPATLSSLSFRLSGTMTTNLQDAASLLL